MTLPRNNKSTTPKSSNREKRTMRLTVAMTMTTKTTATCDTMETATGRRTGNAKTVTQPQSSLLKRMRTRTIKMAVVWMAMKIMMDMVPMTMMATEASTMTEMAIMTVTTSTLGNEEPQKCLSPTPADCTLLRFGYVDASIL